MFNLKKKTCVTFDDRLKTPCMRLCLELVSQQGERELSAVLVDTDFFFCIVF